MFIHPLKHSGDRELTTHQQPAPLWISLILTHTLPNGEVTLAPPELPFHGLGSIR